MIMAAATPPRSSNTPSEASEKKQLHNDLLRFYLPPRQTSNNRYSSGTPRKSGKSNLGSYERFDKKRFVHANFRFVVSDRYPTADTHAIDPDAIVPWEYIEQVVLHSTANLNCPICISPPVAPQIATCGHIFCYSCIIHYLMLGEKPNGWRACPICHEKFHGRELRSALLLPAIDYSQFNLRSASSTSAEEKFLAEAYQVDLNKPRDHMIMKLMQRSSGSNVVMPAYLYPSQPLTQLFTLKGAFNADLFAFSKLLMASSQYICDNIIMAELHQLSQAKAEATQLGDTEELVFIDMAIGRAEERMVRVKADMSRGVENTNAAAKTLSYSPPSRSPAVVPTEMDYLNDAAGSLTLPPPMMAPDPFADLNSANDSEEQLRVSSSASDSDSSGSTSAQSTSIETSPTLHPTGASSQQIQKSPASFKALSVPQIDNNVNKAKASSYSINDGMFYFYQSVDGQHFYLHPLEIKMLKSEYSSYNNFPHEICVKIDTITESTLNEDARKRYKYLSHLPLGCDVNFVEIDWKASTNVCKVAVDSTTASRFSSSPTNYIKDTRMPLISPQTLSTWKQDLKARSQKRRHKEKKEQKEAQRRRSVSGTVSANTHQTPQSTASPPMAVPGAGSNLSVNINNQEVFDFDDWVPLGSCSKTQDGVDRRSPTSPSLGPIPTATLSTSFPPSISYAAKAQGLAPNTYNYPPLQVLEQPVGIVPAVDTRGSSSGGSKAGKKKKIVLLSNSGHQNTG